jgi:putative acetyltransferase
VATIRAERAHDHAAIRTVNARAFGRPDEARLVDLLREQARPFVSLVAVQDGALVGHVSFSPVTVGAADSADCLGLAPLSVLPGWQRRGIGSQLVRAGLQACVEQRARVVVVLGHAHYYPRFGFAPAHRQGLTCEYPVAEDVFMVLELEAGALGGRSGIVRYHSTFATL